MKAGILTYCAASSSRLFPMRLLQHLEDRSPDGQVENDGRGEQRATVHHGSWRKRPLARAAPCPPALQPLEQLFEFGAPHAQCPVPLARLHKVAPPSWPTKSGELCGTLLTLARVGRTPRRPGSRGQRDRRVRLRGNTWAAFRAPQQYAPRPPLRASLTGARRAPQARAGPLLGRG